MGIDIRDATEADLPAILAIHNDAIATSTAIFSFHPVDLANRRAFLAERRARGFPFLVAAEAEVVLGYASFGDFRPHDGYFKTVEHSIYVGREHRRRGVAALLLPPLMASAKALGKNPSCATCRHSRGKPTKLVLADRQSTASTLAMVT